MQVKKSVAIVREKDSVVIRGINNKLKELDYKVFMSSSDEYDVKKYISSASIFVIYLSSDIMENNIEMSNLISYSGLIRESDQDMIIIGEKRFHEEILKRIPILGAYKWLDRPLEIDELVEAIEEVEGSSMEDAFDSLISRSSARIEEKNILIVDDDPVYASTVKEWLKPFYKVDVVTAGMQAITFLMRRGADLVLLDYDMPIVDGAQVFEMLRSEPKVANIPVVFLTGVGDIESVKRVKALGPRGYLLKSITKDELLRYLEKYI